MELKMAAPDADLGRGESPDVRSGVVAWILAGILGTLTIIAVGFTLFFSAEIGRGHVPGHAVPAPGVTPHEGEERRALEAKQRRVLAGATGHVPIESAMDAIAAKGTEAYDPVSAP
jgi:hypothetical protein